MKLAPETVKKAGVMCAYMHKKADDDVQIRGYGEWQELLASRYTEGERIFLDPSTLNWSVGRCIADIYGEDGLQFGATFGSF